ncbi:hypothetical protein ANN_13677 [Periplaneta americana]|uniref:Mariner Mos1 transposase n=1 Tax=Periplaneta americana TaxID=6978 RepID=A0ABQ8TMG8_PERAM|nr:hypothetical protein ANN_13677 [Periplaneta americana]
MSPGSSTESSPAFARIGLRENPGKYLNQISYCDGHVRFDLTTDGGRAKSAVFWAGCARICFLGHVLWRRGERGESDRGRDGSYRDYSRSRTLQKLWFGYKREDASEQRHIESAEFHAADGHDRIFDTVIKNVPRSVEHGIDHTPTEARHVGDGPALDDSGQSSAGQVSWRLDSKLSTASSAIFFRDEVMWDHVFLDKTSGYWDLDIKEAIEIQLDGNNFNRNGTEADNGVASCKFTKEIEIKSTPSAGNVMATVFFDSEGLLLVDIMPHGTTINSDEYVATLKKLQVRLSRVRRHREKQDVLLLHENAQPYVSHKTTDQIRKFG